MLYANKLDNLEDMNKFLKKIQPGKTDSRRNNLNRIINTSKIEFIIKISS